MGFSVAKGTLRIGCDGPILRLETCFFFPCFLWWVLWFLRFVISSDIWVGWLVS